MFVGSCGRKVIFSIFFHFRNLYKQQKLLSIGLDSPIQWLPQLPEGNIGGIQESFGGEDSNSNPQTGYLDAPETPGVFPIMAFMGMVLVLVFIVNHMYNRKSKPRRKRPRLKRMQIQHSQSTIKVPGV